MATACASSKKKKRKHQAVSLELKLNIIAELQKGKSQRLVSDIFHVSRSTVNDIWRQREKIEQYITCCDNLTLVKKRCMIRQVHFPELDKACHIWFLQQRSKGAPVSGPILQEKSTIISENLSSKRSGWILCELRLAPKILSSPWHKIS